MARDVFRIAVRVGRVRCGATHIPEEWSLPRFFARRGAAQNPAYRPSDAFFCRPPLCRSSGLRAANTSLRHLPPLVAPLAGGEICRILHVALRNAALEIFEQLRQC